MHVLNLPFYAVLEEDGVLAVVVGVVFGAVHLEVLSSVLIEQHLEEDEVLLTTLLDFQFLDWILLTSV